MDLDDSFIEKRIQKCKQRKQFLNEKKIATNIVSVGKKRNALVADQQINTELRKEYSSSGAKATERLPSVASAVEEGCSLLNLSKCVEFFQLYEIPPEESPKRQCTEASQVACSPNDKENFHLKDEESNAAFVPFCSESKARGLAALKRSCFNAEEDVTEKELQVNKCSTYVFSTNSTDLCSGRKSRFANLAADIKQWEDDTHRPTLSSNNVTNDNIKTSVSQTLIHTNTPTFASKIPSISSNTPCSASKSNNFSVKLYYTNKSSDVSKLELHNDSNANKRSVSMHDSENLVTISGLKKSNIEVGSGVNIQERLHAWDQAVKATLNTPTTGHYSKHAVKITEETEPNCIKECSIADDESDVDEVIDENDFAENYDEIGFEHQSNAIFEHPSSKLFEEKEKMITKDQSSIGCISENKLSPVQKSVNTNVDPAELPLSARKALFEKALFGGTSKVTENVIDQKLSVAQRAAMFENASKNNFNLKQVSTSKEPKHIATSQIPKHNNIGNIHIGSPVKFGRPSPKNSPVKNLQSTSTESPLKDTAVSHSKYTEFYMKSNSQEVKATSIHSPTKNVGNHTRFIQQKLIESSDSNLKGKEMAAKAIEERKQEISNLVNHWEKLSSSSVENNSEMEKGYDSPEEQYSCESDAIPEFSECDENNSDDTNGNRCTEEEHKANSEYYEEKSDTEECVFDSQDASIENLSPKSNYIDESNVHSKEDTQSISSPKSAIPSESYTGILSYFDENSNNASSCKGGNFATTADMTNYNLMGETSSNLKQNNNTEVPLLYTVSFYRKQKQEVRSTPVRTIVRRETVSSPEQPDVDYTQLIQERIKTLQEEILRQQTVISQTSQALNLCTASAEFSGSTEQVEGERLLLIATQKRQACLNEIQRLKTCASQNQKITDDQGTLTITDMQLPLKREFIASQLEGRGNDAVHYFLCLIRHGAQVIVTQMMSTNDKLCDGALCFTNHIKLQNLPADFSVVFEVYALQTKKDMLSHEKKYRIKREHSKIRLTPKGKKADSKILMPAISSPGGPNAVRSPSFGVVGFTRFTLQNCNKKTFTLDKVPFTSPIDGVLRVKLKLHAEHKVLEKGFLTMFEDVSGFGAWHRRWCALESHYIVYWKYPDDEQKKEPIGAIDLKQCVTGEVKLVSRDICARPHTFQLITVRPQAKGDKDTLVSRIYNTLTSTKYLLSADTKEERIHWCNKLNEALTNIRKWDPQALRANDSIKV